MKRFNKYLIDNLALGLSTVGCFYLIFALVIVPLFFQHPTDLVGWVQYIVQSIFQGVALPVLGYVARIAGEKQEQLLQETHDAVMEELAEMKVMHQETHQIHKDLHKRHEKVVDYLERQINPRVR